VKYKNNEMTGITTTYLALGVGSLDLSAHINFKRVVGTHTGAHVEFHRRYLS
jgi:hypothetical protein